HPHPHPHPHPRPHPDPDPDHDLNRPGFELTPRSWTNFKGVSMAKYETEFKLKVVKSFLAGDGGAKLLARRWSVPEEKIRTWVSHYRRHGIDGLRPKRGSYSALFKLQVLSHQAQEHLSSRQVAAIYDIRNPNQIVVWRRKLDTGGVAALENWTRGCPSMKPIRCLTEPPSTGTMDSTRALRDENERLRAEVAYLKKLHALIRTRRSIALTNRASFSD